MFPRPHSKANQFSNQCTRSRKLKGAPNSQHLFSEAADITTGSIAGNKQLFELVQSLNLPFDQLIDEKGFRWVHVSYREKGNRGQVLRK